MSTINDPDNLSYGNASSSTAPVLIDTASKTIKLVAGKGNLTTDGVTGDCLYSFIKECWHSDINNLNLIAYSIPMQPITDEQFEFINGWKPADDATRKLIRTAGWAEYDANGNIARKYVGVITLGSIGSGEYAYFQQTSSGDPINFAYSGSVNEAIQFYGNATYDTETTTFDYSNYLKLFIRVQGKTFDQSQLSDIGVSSISYNVCRFPLSNDTDTHIAASDATVSTSSPYSGITITYYATPQSKTIGSSSYQFSIIINGNNASNEQIYEKIQYLLRQSSDIDAGAGSIIGKTASSLLSFVGDTLNTSTGVFIDNLNASYINNVSFVDASGNTVTYPYTASVTFNYNANLTADSNAIFKAFFTNDDAATNPTGKNFGTANAIIVKDASGHDMAGSIGGSPVKTYTFAYDSNVQRGAGSAGKDAPITVVAIGLNNAQYVIATGTITKSTSNTVSLVSALERNYSNPL